MRATLHLTFHLFESNISEHTVMMLFCTCSYYNILTLEELLPCFCVSSHSDKLMQCLCNICATFLFELEIVNAY